MADGGERPANSAFRHDVLAGLAAPIKAIPARWFYDARGSALFEAITQLPEYYVTRVETALLARIAPDIATLAGPGRAVVEFGSGSSTKTPLLLRAVTPAAYVPIDISGDFLRAAAAALAADFPDLAVYPVEADFMVGVTLPPAIAPLPKLGFFPGSTIGNMVAATAVDLLRGFKTTLGVGAQLLIGIDRLKDEPTLLAAYDDAAGTTAAFNLNLLARINAELGGTIPTEAFRHRAIWNDRMSRIEMHLEAARALTFEVEGVAFAMAAGETIHTENSHKYGLRDARLLLRAGGWGLLGEWTDDANHFAILMAEAEAPRTAP